jgi:hypothetical protein
MNKSEISYHQPTNQYLRLGPNGKRTPLKRNPKVEAVLEQCLALWDYYEEPIGATNATVSQSSVDNELLIGLCAEVELAMEYCLLTGEKELILDHYLHEFSRQDMADKHGFNKYATKQKRELPFLRMADFLERHFRWDILGQEDDHVRPHTRTCKSCARTA